MPLINGNFYMNPAYGEALERGLADDALDTDTGYNPGGEGSDSATEAQPEPADPQAPAQQPARQQPQPAQPQPQDRLTPEQRRVAAAQAYAEGTDATQAEHEAMISAMLNRANSGDRQYVNQGRAVNFENVMGATAPNGRNQFQGYRGRDYNAHFTGAANNQGARNATAAAANISRNGPTNNATFYIATGGQPPTQRQVRNLGNVHQVGQVGRVYLYAPGPAPR